MPCFRLGYSFSKIYPPVASDEIIPPPQLELELLYELTMYGNMNRVKEKIRQLEEIDGKYTSFAQKIYDHAQRYEDELILGFLEQLMKLRIEN